MWRCQAGAVGVGAPAVCVWWVARLCICLVCMWMWVRGGQMVLRWGVVWCLGEGQVHKTAQEAVLVVLGARTIQVAGVAGAIVHGGGLEAVGAGGRAVGAQEGNPAKTIGAAGRDYLVMELEPAPGALAHQRIEATGCLLHSTAAAQGPMALLVHLVLLPPAVRPMRLCGAAMDGRH